MNDRTLLRRPRRPQMFTALSCLAAPFMTIGRETSALVSNPRAFFGGLIGAGLICAALVAAFTARPAEASELGPELDFDAGVMTPLGIVHPEDVKVITVDMHTVEDTPPEAVTKDPTPEPESKEPQPEVDEPKPKPPKPITPKPESPPGDHDSQSNTPYPDPPTVDENVGNPFGDPQGWGELVEDGDAWATSVMKALNAMSIPAWAAQVPNGRYTFRLQVCKDGRIAKVFTSSSSGDASLDAAIRNELTRTRLPSMPARISKNMTSSCATLKYSFVWSRDRVR